MKFTFPKDASEEFIRRKLKRSRCTESEIKGYLRGWSLVKNNKTNKDK